MNYKVYFIPGLGCDYRAFSKLIPHLNIDSDSINYIEYEEPNTVFGTIEEYAKRIALKIPENEGQNVLIGLSLGGMIATELAKIIPNNKLVIISSIKHQSERPLLLKIARKIPLHHLTPSWFTKTMTPRFAKWLKISDTESSLLFKEMLQDRSARHIRWARQAAVKWKNVAMPANYIHIHGTKDHIFRKTTMQVTHPIQDATHNMVLDRALEIAKILNEEVFDTLTK